MSFLSALNALSPSFPKYEILEEIGHGGMATVYRARDKRLGREVALKVIHRHLRENEEVGRRFAGEALAVAKVKHPNIVEVYDVSGDDEEERYLVVELIEGQTLRQLLARHAPLPPEIAACIAVEITRALAQAHRQGVIHRDVKPENVLLRMVDPEVAVESGESVRVKLTDFGIAKLLDAQGVTCTGQVLGSPAHMAPEQIEGGDVDARSDVFGVGVMLYEMMTGTLPFEGKNPAQVLRRVLEGSFVPAERARPEVGSRYGQIVSRALAHVPDQRYSSVSALGEALELELKGLGVADVRLELVRFLDDPEGYQVEHRATLPDRLAAVANEARRNGDIVVSASQFNRALAYRPDNTILLAEVAGLARRGRLKRRLIRALSVVGLGILGVVCVLGSIFLWSTLRKKAEQESSPEVPVKPPAVEVAQKQAEPSVPQEPPPVPEGPMTKEPPRKASSRPALAKPERLPTPGTRLVRTPVVGPQNAKVRIDGVLQPWFAVHELSLGPHTFEFVPPNGECCETSPPRTVEITAGEEHQVVRGSIGFRPAVLRFEAPRGAKASCGVVGVIEAGGSRSVPMSQPERALTCTILPVPGGNGEIKRIDVDLRPGRTLTLTGS